MPAGIEAFAEGVAPGSGDVGHGDGDGAVGVDGRWGWGAQGMGPAVGEAQPVRSGGVFGGCRVEALGWCSAGMFGARPTRLWASVGPHVLPQCREVVDLDSDGWRSPGPGRPDPAARWPGVRARGTRWRRRPMSRGRLRHVSPMIDSGSCHTGSAGSKASGRAGPSSRWAPSVATWITARSGVARCCGLSTAVQGPLGHVWTRASVR